MVDPGVSAIKVPSAGILGDFRASQAANGGVAGGKRATVAGPEPGTGPVTGQGVVCDRSSLLSRKQIGSESLPGAMGHDVVGLWQAL